MKEISDKFHQGALTIIFFSDFCSPGTIHAQLCIRATDDGKHFQCSNAVLLTKLDHYFRLQWMQSHILAFQKIANSVI